MKRITSLIAIILFSVGAVAAQPKSKEGQAANSDRGRQVVKKASSRSQSAKSRGPLVLQVGPRTTYLKEGLSIEDVVSFLGQPIVVSEQQEGNAHLTTCIFARSEERVMVVEFVNGLLARSRTTTREHLTQSAKASL